MTWIRISTLLGPSLPNDFQIHMCNGTQSKKFWPKGLPSKFLVQKVMRENLRRLQKHADLRDFLNRHSGVLSG